MSELPKIALASKIPQMRVSDPDISGSAHRAYCIFMLHLLV